MKPKVSVVIPVYNAEKYLEICVESILNQTYKSLEVILVDDGAKDNSPQICDRLRDKDDRVFVIHKDNEGAGKSRNRGIEAATGDYILFVDSDDCIKPTLIEKCLSAASGSQSAIVMYGVENIDENGHIIGESVPYSDQYVFIDDEVTEKFLPEMIFSEDKKRRNLEMPACMANFYSLDVIRRTSWKFESEKEYMSEDLYSLLKLYRHIDKLVVINEALYCYRHGHESLSTSSRLTNYELIRKFYTQCVTVCKDNCYSEDVLRRMSEPYLSFTITCLKIKSRQNKRLIGKNIELNEILHDSQLHDVLKQRDLKKEKKAKRILYRAILNNNYLIAKVLIAFQAYRSMR